MKKKTHVGSGLCSLQDRDGSSGIFGKKVSTAANEKEAETETHTETDGSLR